MSCTHNTMTARPPHARFAWVCAECGYIYGVSTMLETKTLREVYEHLRTELETDGMVDEYFSTLYQYEEDMAKQSPRTRKEHETRGFGPLTNETKWADLRYRWISVFPVTGGSEGHYVHVDLIWQREYQEGRVPLFLAKTFQGLDHAIGIAGKLARLLEV